MSKTDDSYEPPPTPRELRDFGRSKGMLVSTYGRIPAAIYVMWNRENPEHPARPRGDPKRPARVHVPPGQPSKSELREYARNLGFNVSKVPREIYIRWNKERPDRPVDVPVSIDLGWNPGEW